jgi:hypothetical protein
MDREATDTCGEEGLHDLRCEPVSPEAPRELQRERGPPWRAAQPRDRASDLGCPLGATVEAVVGDEEPADSTTVDQVPELRDDVSYAAIPGGGSERLMTGAATGRAGAGGSDGGGPERPASRPGRPQDPALAAARGVAPEVDEVPRGSGLHPRGPGGRAVELRPCGTLPAGAWDAGPPGFGLWLAAIGGAPEGGLEGPRQALVRISNQGDVRRPGRHDRSSIFGAVAHQRDPDGGAASVQAAPNADEVFEAARCIAAPRQHHGGGSGGVQPIGDGGFTEALQPAVEDPEAIDAKLPERLVGANSARGSEELCGSEGLAVPRLLSRGRIGQDEGDAEVPLKVLTCVLGSSVCFTHAVSLGIKRGSKPASSGRLRRTLVRGQRPE